jgi:hypothetical protein
MLRENERCRTKSVVCLVQRDVPEKCGGKKDKDTRHQATMLAWCWCYRVIFEGCAEEERRPADSAARTGAFCGPAEPVYGLRRANASTGATMWGQQGKALLVVTRELSILKLQHELRRRTTEVRSEKLAHY